MEIKDYLDDDCDTRVVFYNQYDGTDGLMELWNLEIQMTPILSEYIQKEYINYENLLSSQ